MKTYKYLPGGNPTLLIDNITQEIERSDYSKKAQNFLGQSVEQVGYIEKGKKTPFRLVMMGGEFCINALRSLAMWVWERTSEQEMLLESSGTDELIRCEVKDGEVSIFIAPSGIQTIVMDERSTLVLLNGIAHLVEKDFVWSGEESIKKVFLERIYPLIAKKTETYQAVGYIGIGADFKIYPLVYVKDTQSLIYESACGSGTLAAFIALTGKQKIFLQPSGLPFSVEQRGDFYCLTSKVISMA